MSIPLGQDLESEEDVESLKRDIDQLTSKWTQLKGDYEALDDRFDTLVKHLGEADDTKSTYASDDDETDADSTISHNTTSWDEYRVKPEVRDLNYDLFKNRYGDEDSQFCIEVLLGGPDLPDQIQHELDRRGDSKTMPSGIRELEIDTREIHCVRIQSPALLALLCKTGNTPSARGTRNLFPRPFDLLIESFQRMKMTLHKLEEKASSLVPEVPATTEAVGETNPGVTASYPEKNRGQDIHSTDDQRDGIQKKKEAEHREEELLERNETLPELRCYVEFVEKRILPQHQRYNDAKEPQAESVRFQDLWDIFRPGELVYAPGLLQDAGLDSTTQGIYRIIGTEWPQYHTYSRWTVKKSKSAGHPYNSLVFRIFVYSIDYNGEAFEQFRQNLGIPFFRKYKQVNSLNVYPLRYHPGYANIQGSLLKFGRTFLDAIKAKHVTYRGWTSIKDLSGYTRRDYQGKLLKHPEYVESDLIIDFKETFQAIPSWRGSGPGPSNSSPRLPAPTTYGRYWAEDTVPIIHWSNKERSERVSTSFEHILISDGDHRSKPLPNKFLLPLKDPKFEEEDFMLLPNRLFAYVLRDRKFCQVNVRNVRKLGNSTASPFDSLKIDANHLRIIQSVVTSHFQKKELDGIPEYDSMMEQDLIRGKGRGVVMLLHGAPGVGKTATAEAIALEHNKPLFAITCGDLGFTPQGVEKSLNEIFRLANLWDCILLLDEADVFLSQREKTDLKRNALVSVFLRVLEYYNGILFLTTNRVGTLDEAFKSRVHLSLHYPALGREQTREIVRMNLNRLQTVEEQRAKATGKKQLLICSKEICDFAVDHWDRHAADNGLGRWNGRQIRNAVQTAACIAWYDRKTDETPEAKDLPPILGIGQFQVVEKTMALFDGYLIRTKGANDADMSKMRSERDDRTTNIHPEQPQAIPSANNSPLAGRSTGQYVSYRQSAQQPQSNWQLHPQGSPYGHPPAMTSSQASSYGNMPSGSLGGNVPGLSQQSSSAGASYSQQQMSAPQQAFGGPGPSLNPHLPPGGTYLGDEQAGAPRSGGVQGLDTGGRPSGFHGSDAEFHHLQQSSSWQATN